MHIFTVVAAFSAFCGTGADGCLPNWGGEEIESPDSRIVSRGSRCFLCREQIKIRGNRNIGEISQNKPKIHVCGVWRESSDRRRAKKMGAGALKRWKTVTSIKRALCGLRPQRAPYEFGS